MVSIGLPAVLGSKKKAELVTLIPEEVQVDPVPGDLSILDEYWVRERYSRVVIGRSMDGSNIMYFVDEVQLRPEEKAAYSKIFDIIARELNPAEIGKEEDVRKQLLGEARRLGFKYRKAFKMVTREGWDRINYYLERDLLGFGPLNTIMADYRIEDLSCDGVNVPIFVWHRKYESIPTNIRFLNREALDDYIVKLAHKSGKHVSSAFPIVDAMLFGKHRLAASFRDEVSPKGSTFTIRKFREEPFSIVDLVQMGTVSDDMAAYFWMLIENRATIMVIGGTGSGKTTILNALASLIKPGMKLVTVEETAELNLPHENWVQFVSRESYGLTGTKVGQISLFDLVKTSLRYRPDYLIVGEVRGEEAYVMFQAMASVSGDTPVLLKSSEGVKLVEVGKFVDNYYSDGEERVAKPVNGVYALTLEEGNVKFKPIKYVLRHSTPTIYDIKYVGGGVKATASHSVFVMDEESMEVKEKTVATLKEHDLLVSFTSLGDRFRGDQTIDVVELLANYDSVFVTEIPIDIKNSFGITHNPLLLSEYIGFENRASDKSHRGLLSLTTLNSRKSIPARIPLNEDLAFALGAYLADGCVKEHRGKSLVFCFGKNEKEEFLTRVTKTMREMFGDEPYIEDRGTYVLAEYNNTVLANLFEALCGRRREEKHIPPQLWNAPNNIVHAFFDGLKADARRRTKRPNQVSIVQKNFTLITELAWLARLAGLDTRIRKEGQGCHGLTLISRRGRKGALGVGVPIKALRRLYQKLNPASLPYEYTYLFGDRKRSQRFCSRTIAKEVLDWMWRKRRVEPDGEATKLMANILDYISGDATLLPVKSVEKKENVGYVYDLSVPDSEAFFGGANPVLLHNTGHGGLSTLHAENIEYAIRRLVSPPMNVSETYIPLINAVILVERVSLPSPRAGMSIGRRARMTWEVEDFEKYSNVFSWVPQDDIFLSRAKDSTILMRLAERLGKSRRWVINELERRKIVIHWMADKGIRNVKDVARIVYQYYSNPDTLLSKIEEEATIKTEVIQPIFAAPAAVEPSATPSEPETPVRFIEESLIRIYDILVSRKGSASLETLAKDSGMDDVTLWRYLNILKGFGHIQVVEKKEGDRFSTFFTLSERGSSAYETLKSRLSRK